MRSRNNDWYTNIAEPSSRIKSVTTIAAASSSTTGYRKLTLDEHDAHLPRKNTKLTIGNNSYHRSGPLQSGQNDPTCTTDIPRGNRYTHALMKLPSDNPTAPNMTITNDNVCTPSDELTLFST
jgi:hypothetical protein